MRQDGCAQPDNAMRIARLGLGGAIMSNKGSGEDWAHLLQTVLNSGHVKSQLNTARQLVAAQSGVANAVGVIQQVVAASALPTTLAV